VPKSKAKGGKWFLDETLLKVTGDFVTAGEKMVADVGPNDAAAALDAIMRKQALYTLPSMAEEARDMISKPVLLDAMDKMRGKKGTSQVQAITNPTAAQASRPRSTRTARRSGMPSLPPPTCRPRARRLGYGRWPAGSRRSSTSTPRSPT